MTDEQNNCNDPTDGFFSRVKITLEDAYFVGFRPPEASGARVRVEAYSSIDGALAGRRLLGNGYIIEKEEIGTFIEPAMEDEEYYIEWDNTYLAHVVMKRKVKCSEEDSKATAQIIAAAKFAKVLCFMVVQKCEEINVDISTEERLMMENGITNWLNTWADNFER